MAVKCDFCGKNGARQLMDNGAWICARCMKKLGSPEEWDDRIRYMGRAETYEIIHNRANKCKEEKETTRKKNAVIWKAAKICLLICAFSFAQTFIEWTNRETRMNIWIIATILSAFTILIVPICGIVKRKSEKMREKQREAERKQQDDDLIKRQDELNRQKEELAKQKIEFIRQREELNRRRMEFEQQQQREWNRRMNEEYERKRREEEEERRHWKTTDEMTGIQFEQYCATELKRDYEFVRVEFTKTSGDYGGDLVAYHKDGSKWVIQCKRYSGHVGIDAVQEVLGAKVIYKADKMAVMTNNVLTASAKELARKSDVWIRENIKGSMRFD